MKKKKKKEVVEDIEEEQEEDAEEDEDQEEQEEPKDIKLGEIELREGSILVIKKTNYKGDDRVDFRVWKNTARYKGPTRQGFVVPMNKVDDFVEIVEGMKEKLEEK